MFNPLPFKTSRAAFQTRPPPLTCPPSHTPSPRHSAERAWCRCVDIFQGENASFTITSLLCVCAVCVCASASVYVCLWTLPVCMWYLYACMCACTRVSNVCTNMHNVCVHESERGCASERVCVYSQTVWVGRPLLGFWKLRSGEGGFRAPCLD